nr:MAG TPA: zonular occludens toxin [Inoviridae sp.]
MSRRGEVYQRDLNLGGVVDYLRLSADRAESFPLHGIWVYSGAQRSGKTLNMIHTLREIVQRYPKCRVVSNINLYGIQHDIYTGMDSFDKFRNGQDGTVFVIDEIQSLFSSLESKNVSPQQLAVWAQNGKERRVILGTSQRFTRISKAIREQCRFHIECREFFVFRQYRVLDATLYNDDGEYTGKVPPWSFYIPTVEAMLSYNTHEIVKREGDNDVFV